MSTSPINTATSLIRIVSKMGNTPTENMDVTALARYLLHYQHYNAEYSDNDRKRLGYSSPVFAPLKDAAYIRSDAIVLSSTINKWCTDNKPNSLDIKAVIPISSIGISILKFFFSDTHTFFDSSTSHFGIPEEKKVVYLLEISPTDLKNCQTLKEAIAQAWNKPGTHKPDSEVLNKISYIFQLKIQNVDFCLMWGASKKKYYQWAKVSQIFNEVNLKSMDLLAEAGGSPDRLAIHDFLTAGAGHTFSSIMKSLELPLIDEKKFTELELNNFETQWKAFLDQATTESPLPGVALYQTAILQWNSCFFTKYDITKFALPLLISEVASIINQDAHLVQWAKAYQNLCEIVLLCLDTFPLSFAHLPDLHAIVAKDLNVTEGLSLSVGLFPYAMSAFTYCLEHLANDPNLKSIAFISQNYFELGQILNKQKKLAVSSLESLEQIQEIPDILVVDIHPNNAAKKLLFQNALDIWLENNKVTLSKNKKLTIILDLTLNHFLDEEVQNILEVASPLIKSGKLEIFCIQSLAKLVQLGADNFSGGFCFHLSLEPITFPNPLRKKESFFGLLLENFKPNITSYFNLVRRNTDWLQEKLSKTFENIGKTIGHPNHTRGYCVVKTIPNVDSNTVYVGLDFTPKSASNEINNRRIRKTLLDLAELQNLPITARPSFGFALSNLTPIGDHILRFSIGLEDRETLKRYVNLLETFAFLLTLQIAETGILFNYDTFEEHLLNVIKIVNKEIPLPHLPTYPILMDNENDELVKIGEAKLNAEDWSLQITEQETTSKKLEEDEFGLVRLLFGLIYFPNESTYVHPSFPQFEHVYDFDYAFSPSSETFSSDLKLSFGRELKVITPFAEFSEDQVYVTLEESGMQPISIKKVQNALRDDLFLQLHQYHLDYKSYLNGIHLEFKTKKEVLNYSETLKNQYESGGFEQVISWLNNLPEELPLSFFDVNWKYIRKSLDVLCEKLEDIAFDFIFSQNFDCMELIETINKESYKVAITRGFIKRLLLLKSSALTPERVSPIKSFVENLFADQWPKIIEPAFIENWIDIIADNKKGLNPGAKLYLEILFCVIKEIYPNPLYLSSDFFAFVRKTQKLYPPLNEYRIELENQLETSVKQITRVRGLKTCFRIFMQYPLSQQNKFLFLIALKEIPENTRIEWITNPGFYYEPLDFTGHADREDDLILNKTHSRKIAKFFEAIDGERILKDEYQNKRIARSQLKWWNNVTKVTQ